MAKNPKSNGHEGDTLSVALPADFSITAHGHTLTGSDLASMSPKAIAYLVANGYKQSLTDSAAFTKEQKDGKSGAELDGMKAERYATRHADILSGSVGSVSGSRSTPIEKVMHDVAVERIRAICVAKGKPMIKNQPKDGPKHLTVAVQAYLAKFGADVKAEAEARLAASKAAAQDVGDLF